MTRGFCNELRTNIIGARGKMLQTISVILTVKMTVQLAKREQLLMKFTIIAAEDMHHHNQ
jgi:hypothetical protein